MTPPVIHRRLAFAALLLAGTSMLPSSRLSGETSHLAPFIRDGEVLDYTVRVWKGFRFIGAQVGKVRFSTQYRWEGREEGRGEGAPDSILFRANADGGYLGYGIKAQIETECRPGDLFPSRHVFRQRGSSHEDTRIDFEEDRAVFLRRVHCSADPCTEAEHLITVRRRRFWIGPRYSSHEHCTDATCDVDAHWDWVEQARHPLTGPAYDVLSVVYSARSFDPTIGAPPRNLHVVTGMASWMYHISPRKEGEVTVEAGTYDAVLLNMPHEKASGSGGFEGPFGLNKLEAIWVDRRSKVPVRIAGTVTLGVDVNVEITLSGME